MFDIANVTISKYKVFSSQEKEPRYEALLTCMSVLVNTVLGYCKCLFLKYCSWDYLNVVRYLVTEADCNPDVRDNDGDTPLHEACR